RWGRQTVFWARLLPLARPFIAVPAGVARMELWPFVWLTFAGSLPWCWALAYAGLRLAENWHLVREKLHGVDTAVAGLVAVALAWALWHRVRALRHHHSIYHGAPCGARAAGPRCAPPMAPDPVARPRRSRGRLLQHTGPVRCSGGCAGSLLRCPGRRRAPAAMRRAAPTAHGAWCGAPAAPERGVALRSADTQ